MLALAAGPHLDNTDAARHLEPLAVHMGAERALRCTQRRQHGLGGITCRGQKFSQDNQSSQLRGDGRGLSHELTGCINHSHRPCTHVSRPPATHTSGHPPATHAPGHRLNHPCTQPPFQLPTHPSPAAAPRSRPLPPSLPQQRAPPRSGPVASVGQVIPYSVDFAVGLSTAIQPWGGWWAARALSNPVISAHSCLDGRAVPKVPTKHTTSSRQAPGKLPASSQLSPRPHPVGSRSCP